MSVLESQDLTPDASAKPPVSPSHVRRQSSLSHLLDLTSPLTRSKTPEPAPTPFEFSDPKVPTYGTPIQSGAAGDGMQVLVGWDTTKDATLAFEHVLNKMSFAPADHIYLVTVLPPLSSSGSILSNPFSSSSSTQSPTRSGTPPSSHASSIEHGPDYARPPPSPQPDVDESRADRDLRVLKDIRGSAMDRLKVEAEKLKSKGCSITPVIVHSDTPAKALCQLGELHAIDLIVLGRRRLSKLHRVVGAGSVGNYCLAQGHLGRFVIWTAGAAGLLDEVYGTFDKASALKKDYVLPTAKISNPDVTRLINSDEIQSVIRAGGPKIVRRPFSQKKNPLRNSAVLAALNPYAAAAGSQ